MWMLFDDDHRIVAPVVFTQEATMLDWFEKRAQDYGMEDYRFETSRDENGDLELQVFDKHDGTEYSRAYYLRKAEMI